MSIANVTVRDLCGGGVAALVFAGALYVPGYVLGYGVDLFGFRRKGRTERTAWAVLLSFSSVPIAMYFVARAAGLAAVLWLLAACIAAFGAIQVRRRETLLALNRKTWMLVGVAAAWSVFVLLSLVDVQIGHRLYFSVVEFDQSYRVSFTDAVLRTGVPPDNPLYFSGHLAPMRYYYFWYIVCAAVARLAGVSARQALLASSIWVGFGLVAVIALWMRIVCRAGRHAWQQTRIAVALLAVTGADLVPAIGSIVAQPALNGEMEWWSIDQFYSWQDSILWVPHHTASLLCCLTAFLLLWRTQQEPSRRHRIAALALAAIAMASSFGLSVYVAAGFAMLTLAWLGWLAVRGREGRQLCLRIILAGAGSLVLLAPLLRELAAVPSTSGGGAEAHASGLLQFSVRRMIDPELVTHLPAFAVAARSHPLLLDTCVRLLLLLPGLALELGFYGAIYVLLLVNRFRSRLAPEPARDTLLYLTGCGLLMVLFVRSSVINNNDFAYRASMLPQFLLLVLSAELLTSWWLPHAKSCAVVTRPRRATLYALLALGLGGTVYQALMLRFFLPLEEHVPGAGFQDLAGEVFQARRALEAMSRIAPSDAVVAFNPVDPRPTGRGDVVPPFTFFSRSLLMNAHRQILTAEVPCASEFGGDAAPCARIEQQLSLLYGAQAVGPEQARELCARLVVAYLVATSHDPAWFNPEGWTATLPRVADEPDLRVLDCGPEARSGTIPTIPRK